MAKRTKIVCTLGPAVDSESTLKGLIQAGMDVARFNFSHGTHTEHAARMERLRKVCCEVDSPCATLLDTKGPEIRTGLLKGHEPVHLMAGSAIVLCEEEIEGSAAKVTQTCKGLCEVVEPGTIILLDDGLIELAVDYCEGTSIHCTAQNTGLLGEQKSINLPGVSVPLPTMTAQDKDDLRFGIAQNVDFIAASFIRSAEGVKEIRHFIAENGGEDIEFISKIECAQAVENIDEIIEASDGIMIARGDLGVEVPAHKVPHIQKQIIRKCNAASKPVITATQMLDSMTRNPRPTRAEVGDVANAIYDGTDAIMLSGETACGHYPVPTVQMAARIASESEPYLFDEFMLHEGSNSGNVALAVGTSAVQTAKCVGATCIVAPTMTGRTSRLVSHLRPGVPIYAVTPNEKVMRQQQINWGVTPMLGDVQGDMLRVVNNAREAVVKHNFVKAGDTTVITAGDPATSPQILPTKTGEPPTIAGTNVMYVVQIHEEDVARAKGGVQNV